MTSEEAPQDETVVIEVAGRVTIGHDAKVRDAINDATDAGASNVLLNMQGVSKLDSSGIGELVAAHARINDAGGRLLLVALPERVSTVLQITNLVGVLELYDDVETALASLDAGD